MNLELKESTKKLEVALIIPWEKKCGIATYSEFLSQSLSAHCYINSYPLPTVYFKEAYSNLARRINRQQSDLVHIQHAPAIFGGDRKSVFVFAGFLSALESKAVITLHETGRGKRLYKKVRGIMDLMMNFKNFNFNLWYGPLLNRLFARTLNKAEVIIVHSLSQKNFLVRSGVSEEKIKVIKHGIPEVPAIKLTRDQLKIQYAYQDKFILSTFGFIKRFKDYATVIRALKELPANVIYIIAGGPQTREDEIYLNELKQLVKKLNLENRVKFSGYLSGEMMHSYHVMADLMIFPYKTSAASGAMAHSFAYGKAVLSTDLPINQDIIRDDPNTLLIYSSPQSLLENILKVYGSNNFQEELENSSLAYARKYSFSEIGKETYALYEETFKKR